MRAVGFSVIGIAAAFVLAFFGVFWVMAKADAALAEWDLLSPLR
jgi:hypothetical protein